MPIMTTITTRCVQACWFEFLMGYFNVKIYDIWEGNVITKSEILTENIRSLGFPHLREGVIFKGTTVTS